MTVVTRLRDWLSARFQGLSNRQLCALVGAPLFLVVVLAFLVGSRPPGPAALSAPATAAPHHAPFSTQVTYRVTDSAGSFSVTYGDLSGGTRQDTSASDFSQTIPVLVGQHPLATLLAQNGADHGSITCEIDVDGAAVKSATSSGPYAVVSCSAVVD